MGGSPLLLAMALLAAPGDFPRPAWVASDRVEVFEAPDEAGFITGTLSRGDRVVVRRLAPEGWAAIDPPPGSFSLIDDDDIEEVDETHARVAARFAVVHPGRDRSRTPGTARVTLREGAVVRLLDRRPLVVRGRDESTTWIAIVPPPDEARYVRSDDLLDAPLVMGDAEADPKSREALISSMQGLEPDRKRARPEPIRVGPIDDGFGDVHAGSDEPNLSPDFLSRLRRAESIHRQILRLPLDRWDLAPARSAYKAMLTPNLAPPERAALESRLDRVDRQDAAARGARTMGSVLKKSRERDSAIADLRRKVAESAVPETPEYDARGLMQATSQRLDGRRLYALIDREGKVSAYVLLPPGLTPGPLLARQVGVRGDSRYDSGLRARLIVAKDLDPLGEKP